MGRVYSAVFEGVSVSVAQDLFELNAPADAAVRLLAVHITQDTSETSEQLPFTIKRVATSGSIGSIPTARPMQVGDPAFGGTVEANNTTRGGTPTTIRRRSENVLAGVHWIFPLGQEIYLSPSGILVVGLETAPGAALTMSGEIVFEEIGG